MTLKDRIPRDDVFRSPTRRALPFFLVPESAWCHPSPQKGASPWWPPPNCPLPVREGITAARPRHRLSVFFQLQGQHRELGLQLRSAEAVKRQAEWKEARSSLGGVPRAAAGFRLTLCGAQASVPDRGLVAVYCGPGCYLALKGAWQPGSVHDDVFLHKPGALQAYGEGSASFYPHPRTQQAQGRQGISYRTWKRSGQTEPQGFIPSVSSSRRGNLEPGKQSVLTTSHRAAWPQLCPWTLPGSPASCLLCEHQGVKRAPSWHVHCDQTLSFLLTPRSSF